jgi:hypothetical protein
MYKDIVPPLVVFIGTLKVYKSHQFLIKKRRKSDILSAGENSSVSLNGTRFTRAGAIQMIFYG